MHINHDEDDELTDIPKFWEAGGLCDASLKQKLKSENYNKCLVCNKLISTDKRQLLRHWKIYHFEKELERSVIPKDKVERSGIKGKLASKKHRGGPRATLKYQCKACKTHPRGCDIPKHYKIMTDWDLLAKMRSSGIALEEVRKKADAHTLFMFENGYTKNLGPTWRSHQLWEG